MIFEAKLNETSTLKDLKVNLNTKIWVDKNPIFKIRNRALETSKAAIKIFLIDLNIKNLGVAIPENVPVNLLLEILNHEKIGRVEKTVSNILKVKRPNHVRADLVLIFMV